MSLVVTPAPERRDRADALERLLEELSVSIRSQHRILASDDQAIVLEPGGIALIYMLSGEARLPRDAGLPDIVSAGDAVLTSGHRAISLQVRAGAGVLVTNLALNDDAAHLNDLLPAAAWVRRFDDLEPGVAALAHHMGIQPTTAASRYGDPVICRMMATMLLQAMVRAWTVAGCAPEGWPSRTGDPFLDRVVAAVRDDPGHAWTVEEMASVAALSRSVFAERFHAVIGRSPAGYVTEVRMEAAKRMLDAGRSVSDTSRSLGYGSDEGFSRAFRRATGAPPSRWRTRREAVLV
ncbi:AraC-like DNA-binding protein [Microbacterium ginsengiterrae]|uniref:AraC-like DNA-binding protein n=1 Tax=Microbacterium ginsengiterrae TaxID=546115 RepID=A0A7W9FCS4_9MICO|nr:AraC family transcriptional regulator [Microbacterium ginsengiterrae]MBB5742544.1 AraC-like DNA-binding protein [Microbacterium ginsengiterrae]